jgi:VWFA-related protein
MSKSSLFRVVAFALSLVIFLQFRAAAAQGSVERFAITHVDAAEFPQVALVVRAFDADGRAVTGLLPADFEITENDRPMAIDSLEEVDGGLWIHFVIDAGAGMQGDRWDRAREAVTSYLEADSWMRNGLDHVAITAIEAGGPRVLTDYTTDRAQLLNAIEQYDPPGGSDFSAPMRPTADLIEQLDLNPEARDQPRFVVLVTPGLESETGIDSLTQTARDKGVTIHTILARSVARIPCAQAQGGTRPVCDENLRDLALDTGGEFTPYADRNSPNGLYTRMEAARRQYEISYRSDLGESGTHQVAVAGPGGARAVTSYSVVIDPIRILIDSPTEGEVIIREASAYTEDRGAIPPQSFTVIANPIFPDVRRRIIEAELLVNGAVAGRVEFPGETIELPWNLRTITELGVNEQTLQVRILDELGIETVSQPANVKVEVIVPPKPDIPAPIATAMVEGAIFATPTPIPCPLPDVACGPYRAVRGNWVSAASLAVATLALVFAGVVYVNRDKEVVRNATARVTRAVETLTRRQSTAKARAYLKILGGDDDTGRLLPIHGDTRIGRSRSNADIHFRGDEEESVISRLHCTIVDMESHFEIKDESSSYGTFLNGARLTPLVPEKLSDGDEIELAQVQRGGVKLKFQLAGDDELGAGLTETRRTRKRKAAEKAENQGGDDF